MPTFSAITVERVVETNEKNKPKPKKPPSTDKNGAPPRFGSPTLYTTPKSTPIPYISKSFTASPYVINHKRRGPPPPGVVEKIEPKDAPCQNGFLLLDRDQIRDTQLGTNENQINIDVNGIDNDEIREIQQRNNENGANNNDENEPISNENRLNEELRIREGSVVSEKSISAEGKALDELNVETRRIVIGETKGVLTHQGNKENQVNAVESRANEEIRLREESGGRETNNESQVNSNENVADKEIRITEESEVAEKSGIKENKDVNQEFGVENRKIETGGLKGKLKGIYIRLKCDEFDVESNSPDEGRLKSYSCSREFSPKGMMEGSGLANGDDNVVMDLNTGKIPISGSNNAKAISGKNECRGLGENEVCLKNNGDEVLRSPGDVDCTPRTNRSDFFDAEDDLSPEDDVGQSSRSYNLRIHAELDILRSKISVETGRCIRAEEALSLWQNFWKELTAKFSLIGVSLPSIEIDGDGMADVIDNICGQLTVSRTVANAVGRASMRAELENEATVLIDNKNTEISRLRDKLQYYELVNHEMSQRNQEATELARRRRRKLKKRQQWIWSSFAISIAIGTTAVVLRRKFIFHGLK